MNHNAIYDPESFEFFAKTQIHQGKKSEMSLFNNTFMNNTSMSNTHLLIKDDYNNKSVVMIQDKPL